MLDLSDPIAWLVLAAAVGSGLMAGLFGAFSTFIMRALADVPRPMGAVVMQRINVVILRPSFLVVFIGTAVVCVAAPVVGWATFDGATRVWAVVGAVAYVVGCLFVTGTRNVPLNDRLEAVDAASAEGDALWDLYLDRWVAWNHVRSVATLVATVAWIFVAVGVGAA